MAPVAGWRSGRVIGQLGLACSLLASSAARADAPPPPVELQRPKTSFMKRPLLSDYLPPAKRPSLAARPTTLKRADSGVVPATVNAKASAAATHSAPAQPETAASEIQQTAASIAVEAPAADAAAPRPRPRPDSVATVPPSVAARRRPASKAVAPKPLAKQIEQVAQPVAAKGKPEQKVDPKTAIPAPPPASKTVAKSTTVVKDSSTASTESTPAKTRKSPVNSATKPDTATAAPAIKTIKHTPGMILPEDVLEGRAVLEIKAEPIDGPHLQWRPGLVKSKNKCVTVSETVTVVKPSAEADVASDPEASEAPSAADAKEEAVAANELSASSSDDTPTPAAAEKPAANPFGRIPTSRERSIERGRAPIITSTPAEVSPASAPGPAKPKGILHRAAHWIGQGSQKGEHK